VISAAVDVGVCPGAEGAALTPLVLIARSTLSQHRSQSRLHFVSEEVYTGIETGVVKLAYDGHCGDEQHSVLQS
jgi:hypothetical protein